MLIQAIHRALLRALLCFAALAPVLHAQSAAGTWQGTLPVPENPRTVLRITTGADGSLRGQYSAIDRGSDGVPFSRIAFHAPDLTLELDYLGIAYQGKLSSDGRMLTGKWTQNKQTYPLTFALASPDTLWTYAGIAPLAPMSPTADPAYEVATIKPSASDAKQLYYTMRSRRFEAHYTTVFGLIRLAYQIRPEQLEGASGWIDEDRFDIAAQPDTAGQPSLDQQRLMLRKLLADRFGFRVHTVQKVVPAYLMTASRASPILIPSITDPNNHSGIVPRHQPDGQWLIQFNFMTMPEFADVLMNFLPGRQIVDRTSLAGPFDFKLMLPPGTLDEGSGTRDSTLDPGPAIMHAAETQLGMKFESAKTPIEVMVVDRIEKPSAN